MTREEWLSLPPSLALRIVWEVLGKDLEQLDAPKIPRAPRFDSRVSRKGGMFVWASEMNLESLQFWHGKAASGASDPKYGEKNAKQAKELSYWIVYRFAFPSDAWTGERNRRPATGAVPSREPQLHPWEQRGDAAPVAPSSGFADVDDASIDDDPPF